MSNDESSRRRQGVRMQMAEGTAPAATSSTPAQQVLERASSTCEVVDARGRKIVLKRPGPLAEYRFVEILGQSASNDRYLSMTLPLLYVTSIDGEAIPAPVNKRELEALIKLLDEPGLAAVTEGLQKHFAPKDEAAQRDEIKN